MKETLPTEPARRNIMPTLTNEGVELYYEVHGAGTPLLLSHGYSSTCAMWQGQIEPITNAGYKLIIWDMRGHGQSAYPEDPLAYSVAHTISDMAAILDIVSEKGQPAIVGGLSLGGYMSLAFYRIYSERVVKLLIIDTGPGYRSDKARDAWNKTSFETAARFEREGLSSLQSASPERSQVKHRNAKGLAHAARGMLAQRGSEIIDSLPAITVPSLVVVGDEDKPFLGAAEYMTKRIPGANKVVIPSAGHSANIDQPQAFNKVVLDFLRDSSKSSKL